MLKIRRTEWDPIFWERSREIVYVQFEDDFYRDMELMNCYWDDVMGLYYTPDDAVSYEIIGSSR